MTNDLGQAHNFESDYYGWQSEDVKWEPSPLKAAPSLPRLPDQAAAVPDFFARPSGAAHFAALSEAQQNQILGPEVATAVRSGTLKLGDLVTVSPMEAEPDFITQASPDDLGLVKN